MDITPLIMSDQMVVQSYVGGQFKISNQVYTQPVLVFANKVVLWDGGYESLDALKNEFDVVLWGTGKTQRFAAPDLRKKLQALGLRVEFMDTGAACRTYNVLLADGRRVVAALELA